MNIPKSANSRKKLTSYIAQSVQLLNEKDTLTDDLKNISDIVKEELDLSSKEYNSLVKVSYDINRVQSEIEDRQTAISNSEILKEYVI